MPTIQIEKRTRGLFGWIIAILFWGFNLLMLVWFVSAIGLIGKSYQEAQSAAEQAGVAIGTGLGMGMILAFWFLGAAVLGLMMLFTRGKKIITTIERS